MKLESSLIQTLVSTYGSPLYVYDGDDLQQTIRHITQAIPYPRTHFQFATVTNGNITLLQQFGHMGWGLHANTPGDIYLGLQAGFTGDRIVYSGSNLNRAEMAQVLQWGVTTLNLDSLSQLELLTDVYATLRSPAESLKVGLRLNLPELTGDSRIGVHPTEFAAAVALAARSGLQITGLHFYRGSGTNATAAFTQVIRAVIEVAQQLPDWGYLDFGGGFGYPYRHGSVGFDWNEFGQEITTHLLSLDRPLDLIIEPGRAAIAGCAMLLTQVVSVKWQDRKQIVGVDTTVANLTVPSVHGGYRPIVPILPEITTAQTAPTYPTDVCGNTTYSRDYLGRNCALPKLAIGDSLAILDVGAYGYAMSSHFLHRVRPAEVLVEQGSHRLIRQREDYAVLTANQMIKSAIAEPITLTPTPTS